MRQKSQLLEFYLGTDDFDDLDDYLVVYTRKTGCLQSKVVVRNCRVRSMTRQ